MTFDECKINLRRVAGYSALASVATLCCGHQAAAFERGYPGWLLPPGVFMATTAATPPDGLYSFNIAFGAYGELVGPGAPHLPSGSTHAQTATWATGLLFSPGWTFLGAKYEAIIVQPFNMSSTTAPVNSSQAGMHNTVVFPALLSWKLADSGFYVQAGLGVGIPDGTISGKTGLSSVGNPWWTLMPKFSVSYLKDGWNLSTHIYGEFNTENSYTGYQSGDLLHVDFVATKAVGKWSFGPVASYVGQLTSDVSSPFYDNAIFMERFNVWSVGAMVGYDFGPCKLTMWGLSDLQSSASGGSPNQHAADSAAIGQGFRIYANLNFRLMAF
ncbi:transporter [Xanthobacter sp. KR7-225]|uniref:SphA family protein n=1 Tax=Xanthobacter sp. KR7-225 TaxID=3156613 RepID=UPI0032B55B3A